MKNIVKISVGLALILPTLMLADTIYIGGHGGAGAPGSRGGDGYLIGEAGGNGGGAGVAQELRQKLSILIVQEVAIAGIIMEMEMV
jgi:hypothetical protein